MTFGNGAPWEAFRDDPRLNLDEVGSIARWFLVARPKEQYSPPSGLTSNAAWDDPTGTIDSMLPRSPTGSFLGAKSSSTRVVFRLRKKPHGQFDWISIGRNENNDVFLPDVSVSRFHAFFRETPVGGLTIQDAKSANGTVLRGVRVPRQGEGDAMEIASGDPVRFGDIHGVLLNAEGLLALAKARG